MIHEHGYGCLHCALQRIEDKLDLLIQKQGVEMADVTALNAVIEELDVNEVAAVTEFKALSEEIAQLTTERAPTQEQIDAITAKVKSAAEALKAGTPAAPAPASTPPVATPTVAEPPTPPAA
jgi:chromosome segregation ATPase